MLRQARPKAILRPVLLIAYRRWPTRRMGRECCCSAPTPGRHFFSLTPEVHVFSLLFGLRRNLQTAVRRHARPWFRPMVEGLEQRVVPANVTGTVKFGVLSLVAATLNADDDIDLMPSGIPGAVTVTGNGGTTIKNAGNFTFKKVRSIVINLKGGDDTASVDGVEISGGLTFKGGTSVSGNTFLLKNVSHIGGTVTVFNGANTGGSDVLDILPKVEIGGSLIVSHGAGISSTNLSTNLFIGGNLSITGGTALDQIFLTDTSIGGKFTAQLANGGSTVSFLRSTVHKSVRVQATGGADNLEITDVWIGRGLIANLGNGPNDIDIDTTALAPVSSTGTHIGGSLAITTGTFADTISIGDEKEVTVGGAVTIITGNDIGVGDTVDIDDSTFLSTFLVDLGGSNDLLRFDTFLTNDNFNTSIAGKLTVFGRGGNESVHFGDNFAETKLLLGVRPALNGGGGIDSLFLDNYSIDGVDNAPFTPVSF